MAFTDGVNDLPVVGGVKFSGVADGITTGALLWVPRSPAAGDALAAKFVAAAGMYGWNPVGSVLDRLRTADLANGSAPTGVLAIGAFLNQSGVLYKQGNIASGADGGTGQAAAVGGLIYLNGAGTFDKARNNTTVTVLASAARTVATSTGALVNYNGRGVHLDLVVTAKAAATTITIQLLNAGGATIATSGTIAAAVGQAYSVAFYPGVLAAAYSGNGQGLSVLVPRDYILVVTPSDASSVTYSLNVLTQL